MSFFTLSELRAAGERVARKSYRTASRELLLESRAASEDAEYDIFLSHSFSDAEVVLGLASNIRELGHSVYVDWLEDPSDREKVSPATAALLKHRMQHCASLVYATSEAAKDSRWMPWELGYFDGRNPNRVAVLPIMTYTNRSDSYKGREYLGLYPYVVVNPTASSGQMALWVHSESDTYVMFEAWLRGVAPYRRA